jgi:hypothetical protein
MSTPLDAATTQIQQDRDTRVSDATARQGALDARRAALPDTEEREMAPLEAKASAMQTDIQGLQPPKPTQPEPWKGKPPIDAKDYQQFSWAILGMALIGGAASRGNWLGVSSSLNGALKGYMEGNQQRAEQEFKDYQTKFAEAQAHDQRAQKEFEDILQSKTLSINSMLAQINIAAAKYGREDMRLQAQQKSIDGIWTQVEASDRALAQIDNFHERTVDQMNRAKLAQTGGVEVSDEAKRLDGLMSVAQVSLPQGARSSKIYWQKLDDVIKAYPDKQPEELLSMMRSGAIDMKVMMGEAAVLARREGNIEPAIQALNKPGGLYEQLMDAAHDVNFGDAKMANDWRLLAQGKIVANPPVQKLRNLVSDVKAEVVTVLSRSGVPTDAVRRQTDEMFPLDGSVPELQTAVDASKKVAEAVRSGNEDIINALKSGKSIREALAAQPVARYSDPEKERRYQEWKRTHGGQ